MAAKHQTDEDKMDEDGKVKEDDERESDASTQESENDELNDEKVWRRIWKEAWIEQDPETKRKLTKKDGQKIDKKKLSKAIRFLAEDYVEFGQKIGNTDLYVAIGKEKSKLMDNNHDYNEEEASRVAWKNRKYLVNQHAIEPFRKKQKIDDDDKNEDENDDKDGNDDKEDENNDVTKDCRACSLHDVNPNYYPLCILHNE